MAGKKGISGRKSIKGFHQTENKHMRTAYSVQFKKSVLDFLLLNGMHHTIHHFWPESNVANKIYESKRRLIYLWGSKKYSNTIAELSNCNIKRKLSKIRPIGASLHLPTDIEDDIYFWFRSLRKEGIPVTDNVLSLKVLATCKQNNINNENIKITKSWVSRFKKTHRLSLRSKTHQGQKLVTLTEPMTTDFASEVRNKMLELGVLCVWNGDQTAVNYETVPNRTLDHRGAKTIWIKTAGKEKARVSVLLLASSNGEKKRPFLVFKGKPSVKPSTAALNSANNGFGARVWKEVKDLSERYNVQIHCNQKGWFTSEIMVTWLYHNFSDDVSSPKILLLDDFSAHWTNEFVAVARLLNVTLMKVPAGFTSVCQPADVSWNKPLKSNLRKKWSDKLILDLQESGQALKAKSPSRTTLVEWITSSWDQLSTNTIVSGFSRPGFLKPKNGEACDEIDLF